MDHKEYFSHETAIIDEPCTIGKGTKIWHFSHIMVTVTLATIVIFTKMWWFLHKLF
jgi:acyl-[acyl carrier protein]--UDP-N-acetylglucosamine O-acyltransferase